METIQNSWKNKAGQKELQQINTYKKPAEKENS
jgi:hypothetical protein